MVQKSSPPLRHGTLLAVVVGLSLLLLLDVSAAMDNSPCCCNSGGSMANMCSDDAATRMWGCENSARKIVRADPPA